MKRRSLFAVASLVAALFSPCVAQAQGKTLRVVPHANVTILDPVWSTAFVTRNHGYMIYDTLFGTDLAGKPKPQMVDKWNVSKDNLTWTFTLRDGLEFHDGKPVSSEDVVASQCERQQFLGRHAHHHQGCADCHARCQDLCDQAQTAFWCDARSLGQALVQCAFHHARTHRRHTRQ